MFITKVQFYPIFASDDETVSEGKTHSMTSEKPDDESFSKYACSEEFDVSIKLVINAATVLLIM